MRKRFPAYRGLGGPSYADRYSESRKLSTREKGESNPDQKKLLPGSTPLTFGPSVKTPSSTGLLFMLGFFLTTIVLLSLLVWIAA